MEGKTICKENISVRSSNIIFVIRFLAYSFGYRLVVLHDYYK